VSRVQTARKATTYSEEDDDIQAIPSSIDLKTEAADEVIAPEVTYGEGENEEVIAFNLPPIFNY
jgi:hypothetical protein